MALRWYYGEKQKNFYLKFEEKDDALVIVDDNGRRLYTVAQFVNFPDSGLSRLYIYSNIQEEVANAAGLETNGYGQLVVENKFD
jgi:hypothetical protein